MYICDRRVDYTIYKLALFDVNAVCLPALA